MKRHINLNDFKPLGMEFDLGEDENKNPITYKIDFIPAPIEEDIFSKFDKLNEWFSKPQNMTEDQKITISDWIWNTITFSRNENPKITKEDFFSYVGIAERTGILNLMIELMGDRMKKMQEMFGSDEKKTLMSNKT